MTEPSSIWATTAVRHGGLSPGSAAAAAIDARAEVLAMTQAAEDAVLAPNSPGTWSHGLRAALAARTARHHGDQALAEHYLARHPGGTHAALADPACDGAALGLCAAAAFFDRVATAPRDATAEDIARLRSAGIADADIVRLAELDAFLAYQLRLIAGLRLLSGTPA